MKSSLNTRWVIRPFLLLTLPLLLWPGCSKGPVKPTNPQASAEETTKVEISWNKVVGVSKTTPTLQVVVNPPLRRGSTIHDRAFQSLRDLGCDYIRYVPWLPYPKLGVTELEPPKDGKTFWDFSLLDPLTIDFLDATQGHSVILNFSTIPQWMFKTDKPVAYPADPDQVTWDYEQGTELRDPSMKEVADYYARLVSWYTQGGFTDEYGQRHDSGHHYDIAYWEVLNEVNGEHHMTAQFYTALYDAIVTAIHKVNPKIRFVGMAYGGTDPQFFEYFLDHRHHKPGVPLDFVSYHFYAVPTADQNVGAQQFTFFEQADHFLDVVGFIQPLRARLSPETRTDIDEIGSISADDLDQDKPGHVVKEIPNSYWNLSGAVYAYVYAGLAKLGVDVAGESQLVGYPTQFPSVSMVDWKTGGPNARYWVLKLVHDNLGSEDKLVETRSDGPYVYAQGFVTHAGERRILLISKRDRTFKVSLSGADGAKVTYVDQTTAFQPPASASLTGNQLTLSGFEVAVVNLSK
jgi:hypothetical protein